MTRADGISRTAGVWAGPAALVCWGGLSLLAALSAAAVEVFIESSTECAGLLRRDALDEVLCGRYYVRRSVVVAFFALLGLSLLATATWRRLRRASAGDVDADVAARPPLLFVVLAGVVAPLVYVPVAVVTVVVFTSWFAGPGVAQGLPRGWQHVWQDAGVVAACLLFVGRGLALRGAYAAAAVAVPALNALLVGLGDLTRGPSPDRMARLPANPALWLLAGVVVGVVILLFTVAQGHDVRLPPVGLSVTVLLAAVAVTTVALMPQLLPAYAGARGGGPYPGGGPDPHVWLPAVLVPVAASLLLVLVTALHQSRSSRRGRRPPPALDVAHS